MQQANGNTVDAIEEEELHLEGMQNKAGLTAEEEDAFARELAKMMSDTSDRSKQSNKASLDVGLPLIRRQTPASVSTTTEHTTFTFLTKKGAKAQVRCVWPALRDRRVADCELDTINGSAKRSRDSCP